MICGTCLLTVRYCPVSSAEREGFEPPEQLPVHRISSAARSTTPASLLKRLQSYEVFRNLQAHVGFIFSCSVCSGRPPLLR